MIIAPDGNAKEKNTHTNHYTTEELAAFAAVRAALVADAVTEEQLAWRPLIATCLCCKLRVGDAVSKYRRLLELLDGFSIPSWAACFAEVEAEARMTPTDWIDLQRAFEAYAGAGRDRQDRSIFWIRAKPIPRGFEAVAFRSGLLMWLAVHADMLTLRSGCTFVLDTTSQGAPTGNERRMQRAWQSLPLRPQTIFILGTTPLKRRLLNMMIRLASVFTQEKVIERIRFVQTADIDGVIDHGSLPTYMGGGGGGVDDVLGWARARYCAFPPLPFR